MLERSSASLHSLLLLSDTALPLGSFAFSSGLEAFLAHKKHAVQHKSDSSGLSKLSQFEDFFWQSIQNTASTALPYLLTAWKRPTALDELDNDFDASTPCTVARRASIAQGRALIAVWERALAPPLMQTQNTARPEVSAAISVVQDFAVSLKQTIHSAHSAAAEAVAFDTTLNGHLAPLFGATCRASDLNETDTAYVFLLNHAKAMLSAAVRASVFGPYQSHAMLASPKLQECIRTCIMREQNKQASDAMVCVPTMDLWLGRHELLYSRIFNS